MLKQKEVKVLKIKILTQIDETMETESIEVTIKANSNSKQLQEIVQSIQSISENSNMLIGKKENKVFIIAIKNIVMFYTSENNTYCKTMQEQYKIDKKLYELEEMNQNQFIRISKSCIVNINFVDSFDFTYLGNIFVKLKNGEIQSVSKRKIPEITKFLNSLK